MASSTSSSHPTVYPKMAPSPSNFQPTSYPIMAPSSDVDPSEDPFRDSPFLNPHRQSYSVLAAAIPAENAATATAATNANPPVGHLRFSPSRSSLGGSVLRSSPPLHRTSRYVFVALAVAFYASTILLTAAIVLVVRNVTGSTNGKLRASGVIMGLVGGAGVLASGLTAWGMWRNEGGPGGATPRTGIEEQMRIDLELRRSMMKNRASDLTSTVGSEPALGLATVPSPLFDGRRRRRESRTGAFGRTRMSISASADHESVVHENARVGSGISVIDNQEKKRQGSYQGIAASSLSPPTLSSRTIVPYLSSTPDAQLQQYQHLTPPDQDQDQDQYLRPTSPPTPTSAAAATSNEHPDASMAWTHHLSLSTSSIASSSPSVPLPLQDPIHQSSPDLSLLHALAADMGSEDESTRQTKRKRGLEAARTWGALDDDRDDDDDDDEGKGLRGEKGLEAGAEVKSEIENRNWNEWKKTNTNANANANARRWGRVWGRKRKEKG